MRKFLSAAAMLLLIVHVCACSTAQRDAFLKAANASELKPYIDRAIAWMIADFANQKESMIPLREPPSTGHIVGRWFIPSVQAQGLDDGTVRFTYVGWGYRGHPQASNVMFIANAQVVYRPDTFLQDGRAYVTFTPVFEPTIEFQALRITAMAEWGNTPENRTKATEAGRVIFADYLRQGFTVAMDTKLRQETWIGIGPQNTRPEKPYQSFENETEIINEYVDIHEDGIDFIGPIQLKQGDLLRLWLHTDASWKMDCYLMEDAEARTMLLSHVDRDHHPPTQCTALLINEGTQKWEADLIAKGDRIVWVVVDNTDAGKAVPPWDGVDQVVKLTARVSVLPVKNQTYGLVITQVEPDSAASRCGLRAGDVLIEYNGEKLRTLEDLSAARDSAGLESDGLVPFVFERGEARFYAQISKGRMGITSRPR